MYFKGSWTILCCQSRSGLLKSQRSASSRTSLTKSWKRPRTPREQIVDMPIFHVIEETMVARDLSEKRAWDRVASVQQGVDKLATWSMPVPRSTSGGASPNRSLGVCASYSGTKGRSRAGHSIPQVGVILDAP